MNRRNILLIEGFFCIMILFIIVTQVTADSAPPAPTNFTAILSGNTVNFSWQPSTTDPAVAYDLYISPNSMGGTGYAVIGFTYGNTLQYTLPYPNTYSFQLIATNVNYGYQSPPVFTTVVWSGLADAPQNFQASITSNIVTLTWSAPMDDGGSAITFYRLLRNSTYDPTATTYIEGSAYSYTDTLADVGTYNYTIDAKNQYGDGLTAFAQVFFQTVPTAPQAFQETFNGNQGNITWQAPASDGYSTMQSYNLYQTILGTVEPATKLLPNTTSYAVTYLTDGMYSYYLTASNLIGESAATSTITVNWGTSPPTAPQNLTTLQVGNAVNVTWAAPLSDMGSPITNYQIWRGGTDQSATEIANIASGSPDFALLTYQDIAPPPVQYYYYVQAQNAYGTGLRCRTSWIIYGNVSTAPALTYAKLNGMWVDLIWTPSTNNGGLAIQTYNIYRGTSLANMSLVNTTAPTVTTYADYLGLDTGTFLYYITASNLKGESLPSNTMELTYDNFPWNPQNLTLTQTLNQVLLTWIAPQSDGNSPITAYKIYMGYNSGQETLLEYVTGTTFNFTYMLTTAATYYFEVTAVNSICEGPVSNEVMVNFSPSLPSTPLTPRYVVVGSQAILAWDLPANNGGIPITNFTIYLVTTNNYTLIAILPANQTTYAVNLPATGTDTYTIAADNALGEGAWSMEIAVTTPIATSATLSSLYVWIGVTAVICIPFIIVLVANRQSNTSRTKKVHRKEHSTAKSSEKKKVSEKNTKLPEVSSHAIDITILSPTQPIQDMLYTPDVLSVDIQATIHACVYAADFTRYSLPINARTAIQGLASKLYLEDISVSKSTPETLQELAQDCTKAALRSYIGDYVLRTKLRSVRCVDATFEEDIARALFILLRDNPVTLNFTERQVLLALIAAIPPSPDHEDRSRLRQLLLAIPTTPEEPPVINFEVPILSKSEPKLNKNVPTFRFTLWTWLGIIMLVIVGTLTFYPPLIPYWLFSQPASDARPFLTALTYGVMFLGIILYLINTWVKEDLQVLRSDSMIRAIFQKNYSYIIVIPLVTSVLEEIFFCSFLQGWLLPLLDLARWIIIAIGALCFAVYHFYLEYHYGKKSIALIYSLVNLGVGAICGSLYVIYGLWAPIVIDILSIYAVDGYFAAQLSSSKDHISLLQNTIFWVLLCAALLIAYLCLPNLNATDQLNIVLLIGLVVGLLISVSQISPKVKISVIPKDKSLSTTFSTNNQINSFAIEWKDIQYLTQTQFQADTSFTPIFRSFSENGGIDDTITINYSEEALSHIRWGFRTLNLSKHEINYQIKAVGQGIVGGRIGCSYAAVLCGLHLLYKIGYQNQPYWILYNHFPQSVKNFMDENGERIKENPQDCYEEFKQLFNLTLEDDFTVLFGDPIGHSHEIRRILEESPIIANLSNYRTTYPIADDFHTVLILSIIFFDGTFWAIVMDPDAEDEHETGRFCIVEWNYLSEHWDKGYIFNNYDYFKKVIQNGKK